MKLTRRHLFRLLAATPLAALLPPAYIQGIRRTGVITVPMNFVPTAVIPSLQRFLIRFPQGSTSFEGHFADVPVRGDLIVATQDERTIYVRPVGPITTKTSEPPEAAHTEGPVEASATTLEIAGAGGQFHEVCEIHEISLPVIDVTRLDALFEEFEV